MTTTTTKTTTMDKFDTKSSHEPSTQLKIINLIVDVANILSLRCNGHVEIFTWMKEF